MKCEFYFVYECDVKVYINFLKFWEPNLYYVEREVLTYNIIAIFIDKMTKGTYSHRSWDSWDRKTILVK